MALRTSDSCTPTTNSFPASLDSRSSPFGSTETTQSPLSSSQYSTSPPSVVQTAATSVYPYFFSPLDAKGNVSEECRDATFRRLRARLENRTCMDCAARNPTWVSLTHSIYLCLNCSGKHRRLGTHVSFVRSVEMDKFSPEQLLRMELGGNRKAHLFFREHGLIDGKHMDYQSSKVAMKYRSQIDKEVQTVMQKEKLSSAGVLACGGSEASRAFALSAVAPVVGSTAMVSSSSLPLTTPKMSKDGSSSLMRFPSSTSAAKCVASADSFVEQTTTNEASSSSSSSSQPLVSCGRSVNSSTAASVYNANKTRCVGRGASEGMKGKKLGADFDFDQVTRKADMEYIPSSAVCGATATPPTAVSSATYSFVSPKQATTSPVSPKRNINSSSNSGSSGGSLVSTPGLGKFESAKAISSTQFFGADGDTNSCEFSPGEVSQRFGSKTAISSGTLFGTEQSDSPLRGMSFEDSVGVKFEHLRKSTKDRISALAASGSDAMSRIGSWLNS